MPRPFVLPDLGEGLVEAEVVRVLVKEGEIISEDAPLLEVETDKAQVEIPSPMSGRVEKIHVAPHQTVRVGEVLVTFEDGGPLAAPPIPPQGVSPIAAGPTFPIPPQSVSPIASGPASPISPQGVSRPGEAGAALESSQQGTTVRVESPKFVGPVPATPATRRLARELGVDLRAVRGSGSAGRVTDDDVRAAATRSTASDGPPAPTAPSTPSTREIAAKPLARVGLEPPPLPKFEQWGPVERQPLSHLRRIIAERMALSAALIPHVTHFDRADITELDALIRRNLDAARERGVTLTLTSFLLRAAALALRNHPQFNASLDAAAGELIVKRYHHLGVAVATGRGLIVPVLRDVDGKPVLELARELAALAQRVREGKATLDDLRGGTFTITNIGALGGTGAIPIINYPEVAILGVARGREEAVVRDGQIVARLMLPLSLTFDHRVADGADGARFAADIVRRLEHPDQLLLGL
jgi:pyruvate dehydrogenase E2 component (dihydrolipoamide acetyltransferase)